MNEEMRKEFEGWCIDNDLSYQMSFGQYHNAKTQNYWRIWQASREAMKPIKLPNEIKLDLIGDMVANSHQNSYSEGYNDALKDVETAINEAGYKAE